MKHLTFSKQIKIGMLIMAICYLIVFITKIEIFRNIAWILYGLLFLINPVVPQRLPEEKIKNGKIALRICGAIIIYTGLTLNGNLL